MIRLLKFDGPPPPDVAFVGTYTCPRAQAEENGTLKLYVLYRIEGCNLPCGVSARSAVHPVLEHGWADPSAAINEWWFDFSGYDIIGFSAFEEVPEYLTREQRNALPQYE